MRSPSALQAVAGTPNLRESTEDRRPVYWTRALADPPAVYGERLAERPDGTFRRLDPARTKLGAALARGYDGRLPRAGETWLYLGAASGTTASHVADLVGPGGAVFAIEKSIRPFARLLALAQRYPNLLPILADARDPRSYAGIVGIADGVYADVAQPDQAAIVIENGRWCLRRSGVALVALKTASMGRDVGGRAHAQRAVAELAAVGEASPPVGLEPFHKGHFFVEVLPTSRWFVDAPGPASRQGARRAGRGS